MLRAADALQRAAARVDEAYTRYDTYRNGTEGGASRAITLLEFTEAVGATAATVATGGLAGASLLPAAAVVGATAGAYGAVSAGAQQGSEVAHGLRNGFDVGAILRRGATDAVTGFVGALAGGVLTDRLTRGSAATSAMPPTKRSPSSDRPSGFLARCPATTCSLTGSGQ